jgi:hypothetical protein
MADPPAGAEPAWARDGSGAGFTDEAMSSTKKLLAAGLLAASLAIGCADAPPKPYGVETRLQLPGKRRMVWAVAPAINLSGERPVDPLLEADLVYSQLQAVDGLTVIPVNRVAEIYLSLRIDKVESTQQADEVCDLLGCDGLIVPTVTRFDPYDPPKLGAALQLFIKSGSFVRQSNIDPHELIHMATPPPGQAIAAPRGILQAVGMFDSADGSTREAVFRFASGRYDPAGPYGPRQYVVSMDGFSGFVYHELLSRLLRSPELAG